MSGGLSWRIRGNAPVYLFWRVGHVPYLLPSLRALPDTGHSPGQSQERNATDADRAHCSRQPNLYPASESSQVRVITSESRSLNLPDLKLPQHSFP